MSNIKEEEETTRRSQKRDCIETDQEPVSSSESSDPKTLKGRIPKKQKMVPEDDPVVVQARKALEMFREIEAEDAPHTSESKENLGSKTGTKTGTLGGSPRGPKMHYRLPIISQQEEFLL
ncbi:MAG: hypothetical protein SGBAC_009973 [Bacillariaceae sp.]